jgi:hypothetical protein
MTQKRTGKGLPTSYKAYFPLSFAPLSAMISRTRPSAVPATWSPWRSIA